MQRCRTGSSAGPRRAPRLVLPRPARALTVPPPHHHRPATTRSHPAGAARGAQRARGRRAQPDVQHRHRAAGRADRAGGAVGLWRWGAGGWAGCAVSAIHLEFLRAVCSATCASCAGAEPAFCTRCTRCCCSCTARRWRRRGTSAPPTCSSGGRCGPTARGASTCWPSSCWPRCCCCCWTGGAADAMTLGNMLNDWQ